VKVLQDLQLPGDNAFVGYILGAGNPLLDISADVEQELLDRYQLKLNNATLAEAKDLPLFNELVEKYKVFTYCSNSSALCSLCSLLLCFSVLCSLFSVLCSLLSLFFALSALFCICPLSSLSSLFSLKKQQERGEKRVCFVVFCHKFWCFTSGRLHCWWGHPEHYPCGPVDAAGTWGDRLYRLHRQGQVRPNTSNLCFQGWSDVARPGGPQNLHLFSCSLFLFSSSLTSPFLSLSLQLSRQSRGHGFSLRTKRPPLALVQC